MFLELTIPARQAAHLALSLAVPLRMFENTTPKANDSYDPRVVAAFSSPVNVVHRVTALRVYVSLHHQSYQYDPEATDGFQVVISTAPPTVFTRNTTPAYTDYSFDGTGTPAFVRWLVDCSHFRGLRHQSPSFNTCSARLEHAFTLRGGNCLSSATK